MLTIGSTDQDNFEQPGRRYNGIFFHHSIGSFINERNQIDA